MWRQLGRIGTVTEFWRIFTELNPEHVREDAQRPCRLVLLGRPGGGKTTLADSLAESTGRAAAADSLFEIDLLEDSGALNVDALPRADLFVYVIDAAAGISAADRAALEALRRRGCAFVTILNKCDLVPNVPELHYNTYVLLGDIPSDRIAFGSLRQNTGGGNGLASLLLAALPEHRLTLARRLAGVRPLVGDALIVETARVNAEFALLSNLPANIPVVGGLLGGGADFLVLTKNQAMLIFKLAAIHGRDLKSRLPLIAELAPVVGTAFLWRTAAREIVGMLPSPVAAVPKTAIGYAGTYVIGKMAQYYYASGSRPTAEIVRRFAAEAGERWRSLIPRDFGRSLRGRGPTKHELGHQ